ncbi:collagen-binding domain-containing protein [Micromonospora ureilytica]|uniref:collagen-binding domain-containing protein n=1 Tax=Micromonospora ureilytica TaxID=709868 RepID=UPI002E160271
MSWPPTLRPAAASRSTRGRAADRRHGRPYRSGCGSAPGGRGAELRRDDRGQRHGENEGTLAVGSDLTSGTYQLARETAASFVVPGDANPSGLVVGGRVNFAGSVGGHQPAQRDRPAGAAVTCAATYTVSKADYHHGSLRNRDGDRHSAGRPGAGCCASRSRARRRMCCGRW